MTTLDKINTAVRQLRERTDTKVIVLVHEDPNYLELTVSDVTVYTTSNPKELYRLLIAMLLLANNAVINIVKTALKES